VGFSPLFFFNSGCSVMGGQRLLSLKLFPDVFHHSFLSSFFFSADLSHFIFNTPSASCPFFPALFCNRLQVSATLLRFVDNSPPVLDVGRRVAFTPPLSFLLISLFFFHWCLFSLQKHFFPPALSYKALEVRSSNFFGLSNVDAYLRLRVPISFSPHILFLSSCLGTPNAWQLFAMREPLTRIFARPASQQQYLATTLFPTLLALFLQLFFRYFRQVSPMSCLFLSHSRCLFPPQTLAFTIAISVPYHPSETFAQAPRWHCFLPPQLSRRFPCTPTRVV